MGERFNGLAVLALAAGIAVGIAASGWLVGKGITRFKAESRTVTVKGLVEREVDADEATWTLSFRRGSDSLSDAHLRIGADRDAILAFLAKAGFNEREIERRPTRTLDKLAQDFGNQKDVKLRYIVSTAIVVKSADVARVRAAAGETEQLLKAGVILDGAGEGHANPRFSVKRFNDLRPQLLAEATRNARSIAQQFAADSGASVGRIRSANQGSIQIFGTDENDESGPFSATSTPRKKIRVVSTFEFELE